MRKEIRRIGSIIIATFIILSMSSTIAFAQTTEVASNPSEFKALVYKNMTNRVTPITINYTGDSVDFQKKYNRYIVNAYLTDSDNYLAHSFTRLTSNVTGQPGNLTATITITYLSTKEQEDYVTSQAAKIVSEVVLPKMTEQQKAKVLHDYVTNLLNYDNSMQQRSAYSALTSKTVVCQGYAMLLNKLYEKAGLESIVVAGGITGRGLHAWNLVNLDGNWYHVDATSDDWSQNKFYMLTDDELTQNGFNWVKADYPRANTEFAKN